MEMEQELEWRKAQAIAINVDLVPAARRQLEFLAAVDRNRVLYDGPALDLVIYRYNIYWLPLLAKHSNSPFFDGPLVVPLDCEWVWHCHRLNPVRYKSDCKELYGMILDNHNVESTIEGKSKAETEKVWKSLYPDVPYELDFTKLDFNPPSAEAPGSVKCTEYDLLSAVKRQSTFFYQVARPHMSNEQFLEGAVARYKGFLRLIQANRDKSIKSFCVPTYDIDLMWHTHQLHPVSYCKDLLELMGSVLEHDDTDSDRTKGKKLDTGFSVTTKQWEEMYGRRYWRAGAMHKGNAPSPIRITPYPSLDVAKKDSESTENQKIVHLPETKIIEVMLEFVGVKNLPEGHKGGLFVSFSKTQPDSIFNAKRSLTIFSESGEKQVACFICEPTGSLSFELMRHPMSSLQVSKASKTLGSGSVSLEDLLSPASNLTMEKWLEMLPSSKSRSCEPVHLRVAISVTVPTSSPYVLHMIPSRPFLKNSCFFPLPGSIHLLKNWTCITDDNGDEIIRLQMRYSKNSKKRNDGISRKDVIGIVKSGQTNVLAEFTGTEWLLVGSRWSFKLPGIVDKDGHLFELIGDHRVKFFPGRRLEYEPMHCGMQGHCGMQLNDEFMTGVVFSRDDPYGKAVALLNFKSGTIKVNQEWLLYPGLILAFVLVETLKNKGYNSLIINNKTSTENKCSDEDVHKAGIKTIPTSVQEQKSDSHVSKGNAVMPVRGGASGGACNGSCGSRSLDEVNTRACKSGGNGIKGGGCGGSGGCGSGCGNHNSKEHHVEAGACGGSCGGSGGCGNHITNTNHLETGACRGGCGGSGGCGNHISNENRLGAGACGGGCGGSGGCGNRISNESSLKASACGGGCSGSGGCGNHVSNENSLKASACGGGCGGSGGCGNHITNASACGGGCGGSGGCGNHISSKLHVEAGACGGGCGGSGGCGGGCGNHISNDCLEAGACGGGCGGSGGCGNHISNAGACGGCGNGISSKPQVEAGACGGGCGGSGECGNHQQ